MVLSGSCKVESREYNVIVEAGRGEIEVVLIDNNNVIVSAYNKHYDGSVYFYTRNSNKDANLIYKILSDGQKKCTSKNGIPAPFELGAVTVHMFKSKGADYVMSIFSGQIAGADITGSELYELHVYYNNSLQMPYVEYVKKTQVRSSGDFDNITDDDLLAVPVRTVEEIALEKTSIEWLNNKQYYVINDDEIAENIFSILDNYEYDIAYDTETTGLKINCFGKVGSHYEEELKEFNSRNPENSLVADRLVGVIFCVEENVSYYFPVFNRKFKNLYEDKDSHVRKKIIRDIREYYSRRDIYLDQDMKRYVENTKDEEFRLDVILMERIRHILETKHIDTHNGTFEWKVSHLFGIDVNVKDDAMVLHKILYKFRSTTSNRGEPSDLKYLVFREFGIEQWELKDFFPSIKEDKKGTVRGKKRRQVDFSYMDLAGTKIYAPADGDMTLKLARKYKRDLIEKHPEMRYIYEVEIVVSMAVAYMEFYGHRIDETKIEGIRVRTEAEKIIIESEIRQSIGYADAMEINSYNTLKAYLSNNASVDKIIEETFNLRVCIDNNHNKVINLSSPAQVADLLYSELKYPLMSEKRSVDKKSIKALVKEVNNDGSLKYPVAKLYSEYKNKETLLTKFFDNLQNFMYPGGYIFSSYGAIAAATGRMSCSKPNAQQYPKSITNIVLPRDGYIMLDSDYSQIEYRVLTALAKNDYLLKMFEDPDSDYHTLMASVMFGVEYSSVTKKMRSEAKSFNFGIPYGMGFKSLAILLKGNSKKESVEEAKEKYEMYFKNQPKTKVFFDNVKEMASVNGYTKTVFNRYRYYKFTDENGKVDNYRKGAALRQAGNAVIQGSAADIFKIGVARNFNYIRQNHLFGKLLIVNMIHDEQLLEINYRELNVQRVLTDVCDNMEFELENFPPLFVGAGIGKTWGKAKDSHAEIHPTLLKQFREESKSIPIYKTTYDECSDDEVLNYFEKRIYEFRRQKIKAYIEDSNNWYKEIHPAIGSLINSEFNYGRGSEASNYVDESGKTYSSKEFLALNIQSFIEENNMSVDPDVFVLDKSVENMEDIKKENESKNSEDYDDSEESVENIEVDSVDYSVRYEDHEFKLIDEGDKLFGTSIHDIIRIFGACILESKKICGINVSGINNKKKESIIDLITKYSTFDTSNSDACRLVFLKEGNVLYETDVYISGISQDELRRGYMKILSEN